MALPFSIWFNLGPFQAKQAKNGIHIAAPLPPNGMQFGFESMMIPIDAPLPENAPRLDKLYFAPTSASRNY